MSTIETPSKTAYQAQLFQNRLQKKYKELRKWARKNRVTCYRLYDRDIPEIPVSLDLYEFLPLEITTPVEAARFMAAQNARLAANEPSLDEQIKSRTYAVLCLYERPYEKSDVEEADWLCKMAETASNVLGIEDSHVIKKSRSHKSHKNQNDSQTDDLQSTPTKTQDIQYQKNTSNMEISGLVQEQGQLFFIDLTTYLDTGLFFDHRPLRAAIRESASKKRILNLFCYTGSFSVYAASGNAAFVESVDLSNTYLEWTRQNMRQNGFTDKKRYAFTKADCTAFLQEKAVAAKSGTLTVLELYDIIILDPPTFSNSKSTQTVLDINHDWPQLVKDCLNILAPGGTLYFSTNSERLKFDATKLPPRTAAGKLFTCTDITASTFPNDFAGKKPHRAWKLTLSTAETF